MDLSFLYDWLLELTNGQVIFNIIVLACLVYLVHQVSNHLPTEIKTTKTELKQEIKELRREMQENNKELQEKMDKILFYLIDEGQKAPKNVIKNS